MDQNIRIISMVQIEPFNSATNQRYDQRRKMKLEHIKLEWIKKSVILTVILSILIDRLTRSHYWTLAAYDLHRIIDPSY